MEQIDINKLGLEIASMKKILEEIQSYLIDDSLEVSVEVIDEIEQSRKRSNSEFISHEDMQKEFG